MLGLDTKRGPGIDPEPTSLKGGNDLHIGSYLPTIISADRRHFFSYFAGVHITAWIFPARSCAEPTITPASLMSPAWLLSPPSVGRS